MTNVFVQFSDSTETAIGSVFGCAQAESAFQNLGEVDESDPRYLAFITPPEPAVITNPVDKLKAFLEANPDVAAILK